jgi:hypothetical protein
MSANSSRVNSEGKRDVTHVADGQSLENEVKSMVKFAALYNTLRKLTFQISTDRVVRIDTEDRIGTGGVEFPEPPEKWKGWRLCAVLVKQNSGKGAARITGGKSENIVTGPTLDSAQWVAVVGEYQTLMVLGSPTFRCLYICPDSPHS